MNLAEAPIREILTPEGIPVRFRVASVGSRITAFVLDFLLIGLLTLMAVLVVGLSRGATWTLGVAILAVFLLRDFYFIFFEVRRQGATPGKRRLGIRVVDRNGGTLTAASVFARNITREFELFLPIIVLSAPSRVVPGAPDGVTVVAIVWLLVLALFPLFNREHLRVGDLVAGTLVVRAPRTVLLADLTERGSSKRTAAYEFTPEQLDVYGIYELQVLEDLLREHGPENRHARREVAKRIRRKIGYRGRIQNVDRFLGDFYAAQRARLEKGLLMGRRRERKRE